MIKSDVKFLDDTSREKSNKVNNNDQIGYVKFLDDTSRKKQLL